MKYAALILSLLILVFVQVANGQLVGLKFGDRVRVTAPTLNKRMIVGTVEKYSDSVLLVKSENKLISVPLSSVRRLDISRGEKDRRNLGMVLGIIAGGIVSGAAFTKKPRCTECLDFTGLDNALVVSGGVAIGAFVGALIGLTVKTDRWKRLRMNTTLGLSSSGFDNRTVGPGISLKWSLK